MQGSHAWRADGAVFDEDNLVSHAGLVPLLELAERAGLSRLIEEHVRFTEEWVKSGGGERDAEAGLDHCGDGRRCGQYR